MDYLVRVTLAMMLTTIEQWLKPTELRHGSPGPYHLLCALSQHSELCGAKLLICISWERRCHECLAGVPQLQCASKKKMPRKALGSQVSRTKLSSVVIQALRCHNNGLYLVHASRCEGFLLHVCSRIHFWIGMNRKGEPIIENRWLLLVPRICGKMLRVATSVKRQMCWVST